MHFKMLSAICLNLDQSKLLLSGNGLTLYSIDTHQQQTAFENIVEKGEIACNEQFLLFPQCFLLNQTISSPFVHIFDIIVIFLFAAEFEEPKAIFERVIKCQGCLLIMLIVTFCFIFFVVFPRLLSCWHNHRWVFLCVPFVTHNRAQSVIETSHPSSHNKWYVKLH